MAQFTIVNKKTTLQIGDLKTSNTNYKISNSLINISILNYTD